MRNGGRACFQGGKGTALQAQRPGAPCTGPTPTPAAASPCRAGMTRPVQVLQRLAAAFYARAAMQPEGQQRMDPLGMLGGCLEEVWPGCTGAQWAGACISLLR